MIIDSLEIEVTDLNPVGEGRTPQSISLTNREREILALIAAGKIDRDIADSLYIAPATVRVHIHAILHKLRARDRGVQPRYSQNRTRCK